MKKPGNINEHKSAQNENDVVDSSSHDLIVLFNIIDYSKKDNQIMTRNIYDVIFILCGFVLIYIAGLLHSI